MDKTYFKHEYINGQLVEIMFRITVEPFYVGENDRGPVYVNKTVTRIAAKFLTDQKAEIKCIEGEGVEIGLAYFKVLYHVAEIISSAGFETAPHEIESKFEVSEKPN